MTGPVPFFGVSNWPGARASASVLEVSPGRLALAVQLDPIDWVLNIPPFPGGERFMVRFMRQLARSAGELADQLDAAYPAQDTARHAAAESVQAEWFGPDGQTDDLGGGQ